jgi:type IV pilus assembly protein PilQ
MSWRNLGKPALVTGCVLSVLILLMPVMALQQEDKSPETPIKNLQFQAAEIGSVLNFLADYGNVNVVISPEVTGTVTIRLKDVHWRTAMDIIGRTYDLAVVDEEEDYIRVLKAESYRKELTNQREHEAQQRELVGLQTKIVKVSNSVAPDMVETVKSLMTERGKATADSRSNSLVIQEVPDNMQTVVDYITELDSPASQIKISAQLLEIFTDDLEELGVNWTATGSWTSNSGRTITQTGEVLADRNSDLVGRYTVGVPGHDWRVDAFVEAIITSGKGKIIAHPEITTVENKVARIQMGQKVPVKQFDEAGNVVIKFEEVGTILVVTPHITAENQILLHLKPERSNFRFDPAGVIINTNNAETNVIVNNGQTAVIGGLTTQDEVETVVGVPILKDIPLLGHLFKYTNKSIENRDLVIFVTPSIVEEELAMTD